ncbi:MAG: glycosyltransferase family 4 protein [Kiritimatiellae bacterium]|jgi:glycosyltransferase involved in cell wall biosynthesis|nr:glycosyltransferase family 4 protein [Kiritimatiellia bacterium]
MNIALVAPRFAEGTTLGGAETLMRETALSLANSGHTATILSTCATNHFTWKNELPEGEKTFQNIKVILFKTNEDRELDIFYKVQNKISNYEEVTLEEEELWHKNNVGSDDLYKHIKDNIENYDKIIVSPYLFGLIYYSAQICPEKTILLPCLHDEAFAYLQTIKNMFLSVSSYIFNTEPEMNLAKRLYDIDTSKATVIGMTIEDFEVSPGAFSKKHGITSPFILYCGRREVLKGTPMLIDYFAAFRQRTGIDIKLVFTGSGEIEASEEIKKHIIDVGFVSEEDKHNAMADAVALCHPSQNESLSIVILESWLAGKPVIVNGQCEVLKHQCKKSNAGLWFTNYPEFEMELKLLLENPELANQMAANGRDFVTQNYSDQAISEKLNKAILL